jgi:cobaltochelatase CobS
MSFEVTTVNRLAARKLLTLCSVRPELARTMSLRQLKEHLDNFIALGSLTESQVTATLAAASTKNDAPKDFNPPRAGQSWSDGEDMDLRRAFAEGRPINTIAAYHGRTVTGIEARLERNGYIEFDRNTRSYKLTDAGRALRTGGESKTATQMDIERKANGGDFHRYMMEALKHINEDIKKQIPNGAKPETTPGEFATAEQLAAMEAIAAMEAKAPTVEKPTPASNGIDLTPRVVALENDQKATSARVAVLAREASTLNQSISDLIATEVKKVQGAWQRFEIVTQDRVHKIEGLAHKAFPKLLRAVSARTRHDKGALNIWLYGPAGTGKSTAARKLAEAFNLAFHTNGPVGSQWDIRGFTDAQGKIVETAFRRAWINGGVYCWDEGDGSAPAALIEANGALATGFASFPDGVFQRHPDCIVIINGNLRPGAAPDATYNGRYKQDTAFVNRFIAIEWGIDEDLERALLGKLDSIGEQWLRFVKKLRQKIAERGIKGIVVSPRQTQYGLALLDAGAEMDEVMDQTVRFMFTEDQWKQVTA